MRNIDPALSFHWYYEDIPRLSSKKLACRVSLDDDPELLDDNKVSMNVSQANLAYLNILSFVLKFLVMEGSLAVLNAN